MIYSMRKMNLLLYLGLEGVIYLVLFIVVLKTLFKEITKKKKIILKIQVKHTEKS